MRYEWDLGDTLLVILALIIFFLLMWVFFFGLCDIVEVDLVNANADLAGGDQAWEFEVMSRKVPSGEEVRVYGRFVIKVIEFKSQEVVDKLNIESLIEEGDLITCAYYEPTSTQEESLYICIQHENGDVREVKVDIDNQ